MARVHMLRHATGMRMIRRLLRLVAALVPGLFAAGGAFAQAGAVDVTREGDFVIVTAGIDLAVDVKSAWAVLTDYEGYPRFVSDMHSSKILSRGGPESDGPLVIEQKGEFGFLVFTQPVEVRMVVFESPPRTIVARAISGSFRDFIGRYEITPTQAGVRLGYTGRFVPDFVMPPVIGLAAVRYSMQKRFDELVAEIQRRDAEARRAPRDMRPAPPALPSPFAP